MILSNFQTPNSSGNSGVLNDIDAIVKVGPVFTLYYAGVCSL